MKRSLLQSVLGTLMVLILGFSAAYSANFAGFRDALPPPSRFVAAPAIDRDSGTTTRIAEGDSLRSFPWWAPVADFSGTGPTQTDPFTIDRFALQWRVRASCREGSLQVVAARPNGGALAPPLTETDCPSDAIGISVDNGEISLNVEADAPWDLVVEQQVDVPLVEPPTPEMIDGRVIATAKLYGMERRGEGTMAVYRLKDGSVMIRLEDFFVSPNIDLELDVSAHPRPMTADEFTAADRERVALMPVTTGSINYEVPEEIEIEAWRSLVIYCEPLDIAYAGAPLTFP